MSDALEDALRRDARQMRPAEVPAGMERRICAAIDRTEERPAPSRRPLLWWTGGLATLGGAAAALVLALRPPAPAAPNPAERAEAAQLAQAVQAMPAQIWGQVQPQMEAALAHDPVRQEGTALASDARSALSFLAYNFLPQPPQPQTGSG